MKEAEPRLQVVLENVVNQSVGSFSRRLVSTKGATR
jgi:hypothetical protein